MLPTTHTTQTGNRTITLLRKAIVVVAVAVVSMSLLTGVSEARKLSNGKAKAYASQLAEAYSQTLADELNQDPELAPAQDWAADSSSASCKRPSKGARPSAICQIVGSTASPTHTASLECVAKIKVRYKARSSALTFAFVGKPDCHVR
jgi:hypothetical protein